MQKKTFFWHLISVKERGHTSVTNLFLIQYLKFKNWLDFFLKQNQCFYYYYLFFLLTGSFTVLYSQHNGFMIQVNRIYKSKECLPIFWKLFNTLQKCWKAKELIFFLKGDKFELFLLYTSPKCFFIFKTSNKIIIPYRKVMNVTAKMNFWEQ